MNNTVTIFVCGSSLPTRSNFPSCQVLGLRNKQFMIDCGEGAQIRMRQMNFRTARLGHIFISHLHGDHCFGLMGLISSWGMLGRTAELHIHAHRDLELLLGAQLRYFCDKMPYSVIFHAIDPARHELVYEDRTVCVYSLPLKHRVPCCGFLFEEKMQDRHILREMIDAYQIPIAYIPRIKKGEDYVLPDGTRIPNGRLTTPPTPPIRYAYCSDTAYNEDLVPLIQGVDCLYHEATFEEEFLKRAQETQHSTASQAATIARKAGVKKLIIGHFSARHSNQENLLKEARAIFPDTVLGTDKGVYPIAGEVK